MPLPVTLRSLFLEYALSDAFDGTAATASLSDLEAEIERAYDLAAKTESALFTTSHDAVVDDRKAGLDEAKEARKNGSSSVSVTIYNDLKNANDQLDKEYAGFKYEFGDVYGLIADVSTKIDNGTYKDSEALDKALDETAYLLSVVKNIVDTEDNEFEGNEAFADGAFKSYNRVYTAEGETELEQDGGKFNVAKSNGGANQSHYDLTVAYENLKALAAAAEEAAKVVLGDVDGDGSVTAKDAAAILKAIVDGTELGDAADFNADGAKNAKDATAILQSLVG